MTHEPDLQAIKKEILERAIFQYEMRIADLRDQIDKSVFPGRTNS